jgi:hypothetical protein
MTIMLTEAYAWHAAAMDMAPVTVATMAAVMVVASRRGGIVLAASRFHVSMAGIVSVVGRRVAGCYALPQWAAYGKAQEGLAKDPDFAKLMANTANIAELTGRNLTVGIDL